MFVYSLKASSIKFVAILLISVTALLTLVRLVPTYESTAVYLNDEKIVYDGIRQPEDRVTFASQFGWQITLPAAETTDVMIPTEFDPVYEGYNTIQKEQGLNLEKYRGKTVLKETYTITNYPDYEGTVYLNLLIYKGKIVGGDVSAAEIDGFMYGFAGK